MSNLKHFAALPRHVAIIMDGNNRWAKARRLPGLAGHKAGVESVRAVVDTCARYGVESLTLFAFSSENWQRPEAEVRGLMELFNMALRREVKKLHRNGIRLRILGDRSRFSDTLQALMAEAEALTTDNSRMSLNVAANYGGQWDIVQAARTLAREAAAGRIDPDAIDESRFAAALALGDQPPVDLCIRTGGEQRISNFLLWHLAYAELYFSASYWPDFGREALEEAFADFAGRQRRFGKTSEQIEAEQHNA